MAPVQPPPPGAFVFFGERPGTHVTCVSREKGLGRAGVHPPSLLRRQPGHLICRAPGTPQPILGKTRTRRRLRDTPPPQHRPTRALSGEQRATPTCKGESSTTKTRGRLAWDRNCRRAAANVPVLATVPIGRQEILLPCHSNSQPFQRLREAPAAAPRAAQTEEPAGRLLL